MSEVWEEEGARIEAGEEPCKPCKHPKGSRQPVEGFKQGNFTVLFVVLEILSSQCRE